MKININTFGEVIESDITDELKTSFLSYALSVITSRALPDVRDGLKPIHRRIIFSMYKLGLFPWKTFKKSAKIVGDVIGKFHPHGDKSVYDTLVRMAQDFQYRYPIIYPQGNFGSLDGDSPAAMRYTEAKLTKYATMMVQDIEYNTVDFVKNYDNSDLEPTVLTSRLPNLLLNGSDGIAVGVVTNIPPHNLNEVISATIYLIKNPECEITDLLEFIQGPDFPTYGLLLKDKDFYKTYLNGFGAFTIRSKVEIVNEDNGEVKFIIKEVPYYVNKASLVQSIGKLIDEGRIPGITEIRDESNHEGVRVVIEADENIQTNSVLSALYKLTKLETTYHAKMVALVDGKPKINLNIKEILTHYVNFQVSVIKRKTKFLFSKYSKEKEILKAFLIVNKNILKIIQIIQSKKTSKEIETDLTEEFDFTHVQAKAVLNMRLSKLTNIEKNVTIRKLDDINMKISKYNWILAEKDNILTELINDLASIRNKFHSKRRTKIILKEEQLETYGFVKSEMCIVIFTKSNYIKSIKLSNFIIQKRGGKGKKGIILYKDDSPKNIFRCDRKDNLLLFTNLGRVYKMPAYWIPMYSRYAKGIPINNIIPNLEKTREKIIKVIPLIEYDMDDHIIIILTKKGIVKKLNMNNFVKIQKSGKKIINVIAHNDEIADVIQTFIYGKYIIATDVGRIVTSDISKLKFSSRTAYGLKGIKTKTGRAISLSTTNNGRYLLCISKFGNGKISKISSFRVTKRNAIGVKGIRLKYKKDKLLFTENIKKNEEILINTNKGKIIRIDLSEVRLLSRNTQGTRLIKLDENDYVNSVTIIKSFSKELILYNKNIVYTNYID